MSIREALVAWRKALSSAPNNKAHLKTLSQLYAKAVSDETKEATRKSPSPLKPSPPQSMIDANHSKAQAAVDRIVANRAEQTKKASEFRKKKAEERKALKRSSSSSMGPSPKRKRSSPDGSVGGMDEDEDEFRPSGVTSSPPLPLAPLQSRSRRSRNVSSNVSAEMQSEFSIGDFIEVEVEGTSQNGVVMGIKNKDGVVKLDIDLEDGKQLFDFDVS
mmetsp:Transcript_15640/g.31891  ORF Transcript_15640/g.31891 Transcript_15640/m.31891 type:complete len:217 (+) Transcript_15640:162-812(+)